MEKKSDKTVTMVKEMGDCLSSLCHKILRHSNVIEIDHIKPPELY